MKRADQRSSITILVLGDGTWFKITKNKNQITALEIDMKKITNSNLQFFFLFVLSHPNSNSYFSLSLLGGLFLPQKRERWEIIVNINICITILFRTWCTGYYDSCTITTRSTFVLCDDDYRFTIGRCRTITTVSVPASTTATTTTAAAPIFCGWHQNSGWWINTIIIIADSTTIGINGNSHYIVITVTHCWYGGFNCTGLWFRPYGNVYSIRESLVTINWTMLSRKGTLILSTFLQYFFVVTITCRLNINRHSGLIHCAIDTSDHCGK